MQLCNHFYVTKCVFVKWKRFGYLNPITEFSQKESSSMKQSIVLQGVC